MTTKTNKKPFWIIAAILFLLLGSAAMAEPQFTAAEQAEIDKFCEEFGSDLNAVFAVNFDRETLLHKDAEQGNLAVVKYLVSKGMDVQTPTQGHVGYRPLHSAVRGGSIEVVKFLVTQGAEKMENSAKFLKNFFPARGKMLK